MGVPRFQALLRTFAVIIEIGLGMKILKQKFLGSKN
jgi:hypothetical protein